MLKKLLEWFLLAALGLVVIAAASVMVLVKRGWQFDAVLSGSMVPVFQVGGMAVFEPIDAQGVKVGDIITFQYPEMDTPICHRIISIENTAQGLIIHTKGDANDAADEKPVTADMIKGKKVWYISDVGRLLDVSRWGRAPLYFMGRSVPKAVGVVLAVGLAFIGLTLRETFEYILYPFKARQKEILKRRGEQLLKRKKLYGLP